MAAPAKRIDGIASLAFKFFTDDYRVYQDAVGVIRRGCGLCRGLCNARILGFVRNLFEREFLGLTSERRVLASSRLFDLNGEANRVRKKHNRAIIAADVRRFCHQIKRTKFSAHTGGPR